MSNLVSRLALLALLLMALPAAAQPSHPDGANYQWALISDGYDNPLYVTPAGDGTGRLYAVEQLGRIWIIEPDGSVGFEPFLDVGDLITQSVFRGGYTEQGLLGLAFHPNYEINGFFYINYTDLNGDTVIARYTAANPDAADPASAQILLTVDQPFIDHNGGHLLFGPDGYLYIGLGDGGSQGDPNGNAQNPSSLLGKILRIDVGDGNTLTGDKLYTSPESNPFFETGAPEVWAMGFRNPWRFSFDRETGDMYIGDVGEWEREEVNYRASGNPAGFNFGWNYYQGTLLRVEREPSTPSRFAMPIAEYTHGEGCSITGGYVYRGSTLSELQGIYFYGDYCNGRIWTLIRDGEGWSTNVFMDTGRQISSFGEDEAGELYLVDYKGEILRLAAAE
jgi:glucose/arabinose dehydrogenase